MADHTLTFGEFLAQNRTKLTQTDRTFGCSGFTYLLRLCATGMWMHGRQRLVVYRGRQVAGAFIVDHTPHIDHLDAADSRFLQMVGVQFTPPTLTPLGSHLIRDRMVSAEHVKGALKTT